MHLNQRFSDKKIDFCLRLESSGKNEKLPDDKNNQLHHCFRHAEEECVKRFSGFSQSADDNSKGNGKHHESKNIQAIHNVHAEVVRYHSCNLIKSVITRQEGWCKG